MTPGKLRAAMKRLGFADIIEVAIGADLCAAQEAEDFVKEVPEKLPFHGNILLSGMVRNGEKAVPGSGKLHLDGPHPDDADRSTGQAPSAGRKGCVYRTVRGKEA